MAAILPADRQGYWTPGVHVGIPGGIDRFLPGGANQRTNLIDVTQSPYNADNTGVTPSSVAVNSALVAAASNDVVYLPAGIYTFTNAITVKDNVTVRGAGMTNTVINLQLAGGIPFAISSSTAGEFINPAFPSNQVVSGATKGSTNITVVSTISTRPGRMMRVWEQFRGSNVFSSYGYEALKQQTVMVLSTNSTQITFWPPLNSDFDTNTSPRYGRATLDRRFFGLEDLTLNATNLPSGVNTTVQMTQAYACWLYRVAVKHSWSYNLHGENSLNLEIRECLFDGVPSVKTELNIRFFRVSSCLVENNILTDCTPNIMLMNGTCGNVIAYNYINSTAAGAGINANHAPHNHMDLYEGNVSPSIQSDGYEGSAENLVLWRNWFHSRRPETSDAEAAVLVLNRFNRYHYIVGNVLGHATNTPFGTTNGIFTYGYPNIGNAAYSGFAPPWSNPTRQGIGDLTISGTSATSTVAEFTPADDIPAAGLVINGIGGIYLINTYVSSTALSLISSFTAIGPTNRWTFGPGPNGHQEFDLGVTNSMDHLYNFGFNTLDVPGDQTPGEAVPASAFRTEKPAWFGSLAWPPIGPETATSLDLNVAIIPAHAEWLGQSYLNGETGGTLSIQNLRTQELNIAPPP